MSRRLGALAAALLLGLAAGCGGGGDRTGSDSSTAPTASPAVGSVWVADDGADSLTVIDAASSTVTVTLTGLVNPHNVQVSPDGMTVYAVQADDTVVAIDPVTYAVTGIARTGAHPAHVVEAAGKVYVTASDDGAVWVYQAPGLQPLGRIELGDSPHGLRPAPDGSLLVVANTGSGALDLIDPASDTVTGSIPVGAGTVQVAVSPDGRHGYAGVAEPPSVVKVDLQTHEVVGSVGVPALPVQLAITPDGATVLSANEGTADQPGTTVSLIDTAAMSVRQSVATGTGPHGVAVDEAGSHAWVTNSADDTVSVISLDPPTEDTAVPVGAHPAGVSYSPFPPTAASVDVLPLEIPAPA